MVLEPPEMSNQLMLIMLGVLAPFSIRGPVKLRDAGHVAFGTTSQLMLKYSPSSVPRIQKTKGQALLGVRRRRL